MGKITFWRLNMDLIYLLSCLAFDSLVILFAVLFGAIPGKWYRWKTQQLQFVFASISFFAGMLSCIFAKINEEYLLEINTLYTFSFLIIFEVLYAIVFLATLFRLITCVKTNGGLPNEYIYLRGYEYQLSNKLEYTLGNLIYMPNVKAYAIAENYTIIFSGARPEKEIDAGFICKKIGNKTYECLSYIDLNKEFRIKRIINKGINYLVILVFILVPLIVQYTDIAFIDTGNVDEFYSLYEFVVLFLLGSLGCRLFAKIKGFGKILHYLFFVMIIFSIYYFIKFFR